MNKVLQKVMILDKYDEWNTANQKSSQLQLQVGQKIANLRTKESVHKADVAHLIKAYKKWEEASQEAHSKLENLLGTDIPYQHNVFVGKSYKLYKTKRAPKAPPSQVIRKKYTGSVSTRKKST